MILRIVMDNGWHFDVKLHPEKVAKEIREGSSQFVDFRDKDGIMHSVNIDHIVCIKEVDYL